MAVLRLFLATCGAKNVKRNSMDQEALPADLKWPKLQWRSKMCLAIIPFLLSLIVFFYPRLLQEAGLQQMRIALGISLLLAAVLVPTFEWLWRVGHVMHRRVYYYPQLYRRAQREIAELDQTKRYLYYLAQMIGAERTFEIAKAAYREGKLYIVVNKRGGAKLNEGDVLLAIHKKDALPMGWFKLIEVRDREYYAIGESSIDPVWLGFVQKKGEVEVMPHMAAIYLAQGGENGEANCNP